MTNEFELAGPTREGLIYEKQDLLAPMEEGMLAAPHPMVEGTTDTDYYNGDVLGAVEEQVAWVRAHRPDDPTLPENLPPREEYVERVPPSVEHKLAPQAAAGFRTQGQVR